MHSTLLAAIISARKIEEEEVLNGKEGLRPYKMNKN